MGDFNGSTSAVEENHDTCSPREPARGNGKKELEKINMENAEIKKALLGKETMKFQVQIHDARNKEGDRKH